jgi:hypothetical protein
MPTTYKRGKKKTTSKKKPTKKPTKKPAKKESKSGSKGEGGGGGESFGPQEPIVISGGGSVHMKMKFGQFKGSGGSWKNALANLSSLSIDGGPSIPLRPTSVITIMLA